MQDYQTIKNNLKVFRKYYIRPRLRKLRKKLMNAALCALGYSGAALLLLLVLIAPHLEDATYYTMLVVALFLLIGYGVGMIIKYSDCFSIPAQDDDFGGAV